MAELADRAFTEQRLLDAWQQVRDAAMADGEGGPDVDRFEAAAARHVTELAEALRNGSFQPRAARRTGCRDRPAAAAVELAEARDAGAAWVARCDIDDCFEPIPVGKWRAASGKP